MMLGSLCAETIKPVSEGDKISIYFLFFSTTMVGVGILYNISRASAASSTNFGSILIFASCVVGTCNILCG